MGVPGFFGWVKRSYPKCVRAFVEGSGKQQRNKDASSESDSEPDNVEDIQEDSDANPNHIEFDNFYLDMNGLIHACSHGDMYENQPENEEEVMIRIGVALNRLMNAVKPRKIVYMAIDGVAPRAKMNQQRSRRFISAKRQQLAKAHQMDASTSHSSYDFDSNAVTPGTQFMNNVGKFLRAFVHKQLATNPRWKDLQVFISDASVPGEGEHKIMDFIRKQRAQPGFDPNMTHILYGQDADLIFLGLGTHEVGFYILRDSMAIICKKCRRAGHNESTCFMYAPREEKPRAVGEPTEFIPLELVELPLLRQYLFRQFQISREHMDLESIIDDFIMLCIFLGNDFLPSLPTLRISEDGLDLIIKLYRLLFINKHTPLFTKGKIRWENLYWFLDEIAKYESKILRIRHSRKNKPKTEETQFVAPSVDIDPQLKTEDSNKIDIDAELTNEILADIQSTLVDGPAEEEETDLNEEIEMLGSNIQTDKISENLLHKILSGELFEDIMVKRQIECSLLSEIGYPGDKWRENYHRLKFGSGSVKQVGLEYLVGVQWVMEYYLKGCPAWGWYYPYHYTAFAQDLVDCFDAQQIAMINNLWIDYMNKDTGPFEPFQQLLSVLPLQSSKLLPKCYGELMSSPKFESWYPIHFAIDIEQKREGIALLPFIDAAALQDGVAGLKNLLTPEETIRNATRETALLVPNCNHLYADVMVLYTQSASEVALNQLRHFLSGVCKSADRNEPNDLVVTALFQNPPYPEGWTYRPSLLSGAKFSPKDITKEDLVKKKKEFPRAGIGATLYMQPEYAIASFWPKIESTNVGYQMLEKMGWKGGALGKNQQGIEEPVHTTGQEEQPMCSLMDVVELELSDQRRVTSLKLRSKVTPDKVNLYRRISRSFAAKLTENMANYCAMNNLPDLTISCEGLTPEQRSFVHQLARWEAKKPTDGPRYETHSTGPKNNRTLHIACIVPPEVAQKLRAKLQSLSQEQQNLATELDGQKVVETEMERYTTEHPEQTEESQAKTPNPRKKKETKTNNLDFSFAYSDEPVKPSRFAARSAPQKTQVCWQFQRGYCTRGDRCKFLHSPPDQSSWRSNNQFLPGNDNNTVNNHNTGYTIAEGVELAIPQPQRQDRFSTKQQFNDRRWQQSEKTQGNWKGKNDVKEDATEDRKQLDSVEERKQDISEKHDKSRPNRQQRSNKTAFQQKMDISEAPKEAPQGPVSAAVKEAPMQNSPAPQSPMEPMNTQGAAKDKPKSGRGPNPKKEPFRKDTQPEHRKPDNKPERTQEQFALKLTSINRNTKRTVIEDELRKFQIPYVDLFLIRGDVGILKFENESDLRYAIQNIQTPLDTLGIKFAIDTHKSAKTERREPRQMFGGRSERPRNEKNSSSSSVTNDMQALELNDLPTRQSPGLSEVEPEPMQPEVKPTAVAKQPSSNDHKRGPKKHFNKKMKSSSSNFTPQANQPNIPSHPQPSYQPQDSLSFVMNLQQTMNPQEMLLYSQQQAYQYQQAMLHQQGFYPPQEYLQNPEAQGPTVHKRYFPPESQM